MIRILSFLLPLVAYFIAEQLWGGLVGLLTSFAITLIVNGIVWLKEGKFYIGDVVSDFLFVLVFGLVDIVVENIEAKKNQEPRVRSLDELSYKDALIIGLFQLVAACLPGTSRSGATIIGGLIIGVSRTVAAEFTFVLAIPVMAGASLLKIVKYNGALTGDEKMILAVGMIVAFVVSMFIIRFLMNYIRRHDFKVFGWYRIALGAAVILYFALRG